MASPSRLDATAYFLTSLTALYLLLGGASFATFLFDPDLALLSFLLVGAIALGGYVLLARGHSAGAAGGLALVWLLWLGVAAVLAVDRRLAAESWLWQAVHGGLFLVGLLAARDPDRRDAVLAGVLTAAALVALMAAAETFGLRQPAVVYATEFGAARATASLNHPNNLAGFLALVTPPTVGCALAAWQSRRTPAAVGLVLVVFVMLIAAAGTYSRGGQLAVLVGVLAFLLLLPAGGWRAWWRRDRRRAIGITAAVVVALVLLAAILWRTALADRLRLFVELLPTLAKFQRWQTWMAAQRMIGANPLHGVGLGGFGLELPHYKIVGTHAELYTHAHNWYLNLAAEAGLPALVLLGSLGYLAWRRLLAAMAEADEPGPRWRFAGLAAGLVGFGFAGLLDYNVGVPAIGLTFWLLLGLAAGSLPAGREWRPTRPLSGLLVALLVVGAGFWIVWNRGQVRYLQALNQVAQGDLAAAGEALAAARRADPAQQAYRLVETDLLTWAGQEAEAEQRLRALLAEGRLPSYYRSRLAWLRARSGDLAGAAEVLAAAIALDPAEPVLRVDAGLVALEAGRLDEAESQFIQALAMSGEAVGAAAGMGETALRRGQPEAAAKWFGEAATAQSPRDRVARFIIAYNRIDPWPLLPAEQRARLTDRVRFHGSTLPRLRLRAMEIEARTTAPAGTAGEARDAGGR